ncbi:hypothetical protein BW900_29985 [Bacillus mycoides]|uniref:Pycsar effector protein domain-containing protein n=1 Tax=Bacillus mycoides TaxID=1405 RepID=A0A1S9SYR5_BACMY|nr:Pycsar system effector family protein [Bacillus mycoides]OOR02893.1 hypothetical protein BW900_29985 [Bacillus mycoides]
MSNEKIDFIKHHHNYLNDYIKFADVKAAGLVTANGLIIRLLFSSLSNNVYETIHFFSLFGCLVLLISIIFSILVVVPRTNAKASKGLIFWENVFAMDKEEFIKEVSEISSEDLNKKLIEQNYFLAATANKKYVVLRRAFHVSFLGYILLAIAAVIWIIQS